MVEIQDTGAGISKENSKKIFNPFFTTKERGSGLGLAIVRKIIEGHKGTVWIKSEEEWNKCIYYIRPQKNQSKLVESLSG